jgi:hypothetical protein
LWPVPKFEAKIVSRSWPECTVIPKDLAIRRARRSAPHLALVAREATRVHRQTRDLHPPLRHAISFPRCHRIRVLPTLLSKNPSPEGRRSADRRVVGNRASGRGRPLRILRQSSEDSEDTEGARLSALHCGACGANQCHRSAQAAFPGTHGAGRYPATAVPVQRDTSRAGPSAGGDDARTARERGYKPRPQEPHPPHRSAVTGRRPSLGEMSVGTYNGDHYQEVSL